MPSAYITGNSSTFGAYADPKRYFFRTKLPMRHFSINQLLGKTTENNGGKRIKKYKNLKRKKYNLRKRH